MGYILESALRSLKYRLITPILGRICPHKYIKDSAWYWISDRRYTGEAVFRIEHRCTFCGKYFSGTLSALAACVWEPRRGKYMRPDYKVTKGR